MYSFRESRSPPVLSLFPKRRLNQPRRRFFCFARIVFILFLCAVTSEFENESWVVHRGAEVIEKMGTHGANALSDIERLIYLLWRVDYGMRNAGDLLFAGDEYLRNLVDGRALAEKTGLANTKDLFGMNRESFGKEYFDRFESVCDEIRRLDV
jgi:hypothetical protein